MLHVQPFCPASVSALLLSCLLMLCWTKISIIQECELTKCLQGNFFFTSACNHSIKQTHLSSLVDMIEPEQGISALCNYDNMINISGACQYGTFTDVILCRAEIQYYQGLKVSQRVRISVPGLIYRYSNQFELRDPCRGIQQDGKFTKPSYAHAAWYELNSLGGTAFDSSLKIKRVGQLSDKKRTIGLHIRRGDACMVWSNVSLGSNNCFPHGVYVRPCYALSVYMEAAMKMRQLYGAHQVIVMTDSEAVIPSLKEYELFFNFSYNTFDRSAVEGSPMVNIGLDRANTKRNWIEFRNDTPAARLVQHASLMADLRLIRNADMFIGSKCSSLSPLILSLIQSRTDVVPPFIFID